MQREYIKEKKDRDFTFDSNIWWCVSKHKEVLNRFSKGITITMFVKGMRRHGLKNGITYGYAWSNGWLLMRNGIYTVKKAKEISDMLFNEYKVFIPYIELMGRRDAITDQEGVEV